MNRRTYLLVMSLGCLALLPVVVGHSQGPSPQLAVLRLRVRVKESDSAPLHGLARKRFFLVHGTLEQNRALLDAIERQPVTTRDCYYQKNGASSALIAWLKGSDCESIYCREIAPEFVSGPKAVPEFAVAFAASEKEFGSAATALKWVSTNMPENLRDGFYKKQKGVLEALLKQAQTSSGAPIQSVMTDSKGSALFTELGAGTYVL